ncbi:O-antigen ligase family protein [Actinoplanes sp. NBRC 101535]|uniref:O-antigen ligase family protein n=1 Tax=Actinoplanes sp. NBRC 101535 TaxID=3032196 RepID=UPI0024A09F4B|nr:O-antigen ligase family protein [Actinoplanes sp. NBRC 101535]GLY08586.1 hypothetical protein Acsp01_89650 [Actinoplanes sp. NBRC 101535]
MTDAPARPGLVVILLFLTALAGRFTLTRLGLNVPVLNDVRVLLYLVVILALLLEAHRIGSHAAAGGYCLLFVLALLGYQILSASWAPANAVTGPMIGDLCAVGFLVFAYYNLAKWARDHVTRVTLCCFQAAAWVYFLAAASGRGHASNGRWAALGGGPNVFVRVMILGVITALYLHVRSGRRIHWLIPIPAFLFGALASGSRGGIVSLAITAAIAAVAIRPSFTVLARPLGVLAILGTIVAVTAGPTIADFVQTRFIDSTLGQGYTSDRDVLFEYAIRLFWQRPLLGTGLNGFHAISDLGEGERYVHNLPLSVAAEGGFAGLVLLGLAWYSLWRAYRHTPAASRSVEAQAAAYCGIFVGATSLFSGDYFDARLMWILLILAAVRPAPPTYILGGPIGTPWTRASV